MSQPTLANVPQILLRTLLRLLARMVMVVACILLLGGMALGIVSLLLATWRMPRSRRTQMVTDLVLLATETAKDRRRVTKTDSH